MNNLITAESIITRTCASKLELDTCYLESKTFDGKDELVTQYYGKCKSNEICVETTFGEIGGFGHKCVKVKSLLKLEKDCVAKGECQSGVCKDNKCSYLNSGDVCSNDINCGNGLYCKRMYSQEYLDGSYGVCTEYVPEGGNCSDDECKPYLACGTDNKCVKKFSLDDGDETVESSACKSGFSDSHSGKNICISVIVDGP